jgi:dynein heavy chain
VFKLRRQLRDASERLEFLMDYADLPSESVPYACSCMLVFLYKYENVLYLYFKNKNLGESRFIAIPLPSIRKADFQMPTS